MQRMFWASQRPPPASSRNVGVGVAQRFRVAGVQAVRFSGLVFPSRPPDDSIGSGRISNNILLPPI